MWGLGLEIPGEERTFMVTDLRTNMVTGHQDPMVKIEPLA